jgi:hypothetical protein
MLHRKEVLGGDSVLIEQGDAGAYGCEPGAFDVACCIGATWIGGGAAGTIDLLRRVLGTNGLLF